MLNEQKLKQIQVMVKNATVLSAQEKTEWLALIELMNDKQVAELEEILQAPKPAPTPVSQAVNSAEPNSSSLSHISNLPNQMSDAKLSPSVPPVVKPVPVPPPVSPPTPPIPTPAVQQPQPVPVQQVKPEPAPMPKMEPERASVPMPPVTPLPIPKADFTGGNSTSPPVVLSDIDDVVKLTSGALHEQNRKDFHSAINALASHYGYFQVITRIEQSPLYKDYLDYGKAMLSGKKDNLALSQEEFEFVTDILLSLKVNRF